MASKNSLLILFSVTGVALASSDYNESDARIYIEAARAAFCDQKSVESWTCGEMCDAVPVEKGTVHFTQPGDSAKVQAYVAKLTIEPDHCITAFRGSVDPLNWVADFKAWPVKWDRAKDFCPNCSVHDGFLAAYEEIRDDIHSALQKLACTRFTVVGHSLGAAVAQLMTLELRALGKYVPKVYFYGAPRAGDEQFVDTFEKLAAAQKVSPSCWRVIHYHDPVPRLCPWHWPFGFRFMPTEVYYTEDESSYKVCNATDGEDPSCADSVPLFECVNFDHVRYFNKTFMHKEFGPACYQSTGEEESRNSLLV